MLEGWALITWTDAGWKNGLMETMKFRKYKCTLPNLGRKSALQAGSAWLVSSSADKVLGGPGRQQANCKPAVALRATRANSMLGCISRSTDQGKELLPLLSVCYSASRLLLSILHPQQKDVDKLKCIHWRATKMVVVGAPVLWGGLRELGLFSLGKRWLHQDLTAAFSAYGEGIERTDPGSEWQDE